MPPCKPYLYEPELHDLPCEESEPWLLAPSGLDKVGKGGGVDEAHE